MADINDIDIQPLQNKEAQTTCFFKLVSLFTVPFLIFVFFVAGFLGLINFKVEVHSVIMLGFIFVIYLFFMKHNAHYASCRFKQRHKEMYDVMNWYIQNNSLTIGEITKANAPIESFLKDFTASLRNDNFSSVAASIFPTLGILGTFISIAISMPDFSSKDSAMLEREISLLLGGVGTAFYVSIFGIFLSLWWIYFEKSGMSSFDKDIHAIKESVRHKFWTTEEIGQIHFQESLKNSEKLNNVFDKILTNDFINHMNDTLSQRLELFDNIIKHEKIALKRATEHFNNLAKIADESENISFRMQDFTSQLQKSSRVLSNIVEKLDNKERDMLDSLDELNQNISRLKNRDN
jgi:hypothetical protein